MNKIKHRGIVRILSKLRCFMFASCRSFFVFCPFSYLRLRVIFCSVLFKLVFLF
jgi:hypothetical protein